jgi:serine phosphatase RsbU (regulator of sigma subunit)
MNRRKALSWPAAFCIFTVMKNWLLGVWMCGAAMMLGQESPLSKKVSKIDSLKMLVSQSAQDTEAVNNRMRLLREYVRAAEFDSAKKYAQEALMLSIRLGWLKGQAGNYNNMGVVNHFLGNYPEAIDYYTKAIRLRQALGDTPGVAGAYNNLAKIYFNQGNYPKTLEYILKALTIVEKTGNKSLHASLLNDIGNIYTEKPSRALEYYRKSLAIYESIGEKQGIANTNNNIGTMFMELNDKPRALGHFKKALALKQEIGDEKGIANTLDNLGVIYMREKNYEKALECHRRSLGINSRQNEKYAMGPPLTSIANVYREMGEYSLAISFASKSLAMAKEVGSYEQVREAEKSLNATYERMGDMAQAYQHYQGFIAARDSLYNEDKTQKTVQAEMNFQFEKEKAVAKAEQEKKDALHIEQLARKEMVKNFFIGGFVLVLVFAFFMYRNYREKKKANELLAAQKHEIEVQKALVEEKNLEVTDSIKYAQRIQQALLPSEQYLGRYLSDFFILNRPRDIVSGDFYWFLNKDQKLYIATADCTGHGVPGAFMSMLGINFLNEIIMDRNLDDPGQVLDALRAEIIQALNPEGTTELTKDGMDIVLCCFDLANMQLRYSAANNTFYLARQGQITEQKFDKMPVGVAYDQARNFSTHTLPLQKGDVVYTFTDGYADQFGGERGKKFKYKQFEKLLLANAALPLADQKNILLRSHESWKGNLEQVDDILVIGVRI